MKKSHLSEYDIQQLIDLSTPEREQNNAYHHVRVCKVCETRFRELERLHAALRKQQFDHADEAQIERVMERIRFGERKSIMVHLLNKLAYLLAMLLVLTGIGVLFYQLDVLDVSPPGGPNGEMTVDIPEYVQFIQNQFTQLAELLIVMYDRIFGLETAPVVAFTIVFLFFVAIFDRFVLSPILLSRR